MSRRALAVSDGRSHAVNGKAGYAMGYLPEVLCAVTAVLPSHKQLKIKHWRSSVPSSRPLWSCGLTDFLERREQTTVRHVPAIGWPRLSWLVHKSATGGCNTSVIDCCGTWHAREPKPKWVSLSYTYFPTKRLNGTALFATTRNGA